MVAQANKTSKNTTNEIEKMTTVPLYTNKLLNSQNQLEIYFRGVFCPPFRPFPPFFSRPFITLQNIQIVLYQSVTVG